MEWSFIWKAVLIVIMATVFLRIAGRKTISQMTLAETVLMISIGTLLIQPISGKDIWTTIFIGGILVGTLLIMEFLQIKSDTFEKIITGKAKIVIDNGTLNEKNLKNLRLSVDQLEMKLRQANVTKISDVKSATLEPNGQLGLELKQDAQPVTKKDFEEFKQTIVSMLLSQSHYEHINGNSTISNRNYGVNNKDNIFDEIKSEGHQLPHPKHLQ